MLARSTRSARARADEETHEQNRHEADFEAAARNFPMEIEPLRLEDEPCLAGSASPVAPAVAPVAGCLTGCRRFSEDTSWDPNQIRIDDQWASILKSAVGALSTNSGVLLSRMDPPEKNAQESLADASDMGADAVVVCLGYGSSLIPELRSLAIKCVAGQVRSRYLHLRLCMICCVFTDRALTSCGEVMGPSMISAARCLRESEERTSHNIALITLRQTWFAGKPTWSMKLLHVGLVLIFANCQEGQTGTDARAHRAVSGAQHRQLGPHQCAALTDAMPPLTALTCHGSRGMGYEPWLTARTKAASPSAGCLRPPRLATAMSGCSRGWDPGGLPQLLLQMLTACFM
eukprot:758671-Hanusia_phi.AAC.5